MYDTGFRRRNDSPRLDSDDRWRPRMAINNIRFYYGFEIELVPVLRSLLKHCIQVGRIGDDLTCRLGSFPQDAGQDDDGLAGNRVMKSGDYGVVARETLAWNVPLKCPDLFRRALAIHHLANVLVIFKSHR